MWKTGNKTKEGISASARQCIAKKPVVIESCSMSSELGSLCISMSVGDQHGVEVTVSITLDELVAWLPNLIEEEKKWAAQAEGRR